MIAEDQALRDIAQAFGGPLPPQAERYLLEHDLLQEYQLGRITSQNAASRVARMWTPVSTSRPARGTELVENGVSLAEKNLAFCVSQILVLRARREPEVIAFRTDQLHGKLLAKDKIESWVTRTSKREGGATSKGRELVFPTEASEVATSIYVVGGGILDGLRRVCELLAFAYGWPLEHACLFVLSDITPISESIEVGAEINDYIPFRSRVTLKIHPAMSPQEVLKAYTWARNEYFERRSRPQSVKHQTLGLFHAQHVEYAEVELNRRERLDKWNALCTDPGKQGMGWKEGWKYDPTSGLNNFQRDSRKAYLELVKDRRKKVSSS